MKSLQGKAVSGLVFTMSRGVCVYTYTYIHLIVPGKSLMVGGEGVSVYMCVT